MKAKSLALVLALFVAVLAIGANGVYASTLTLQILDNNNHSVTVSEIAGTPGIVQWSGDIGAWNLQLATGKGYPLFGSGAWLDTTFQAVSTTGTATELTIMLTQTGTTAFVPGWSLHVGGTIEGSIDPVTYSAYYDNDNNPFGKAQQIGTTLSFSGGGAFSGYIAGPASPDSEYSLTQVLTFHGTGASGSATGDAALAAPEPAAIWLFGSGLVGVALLVRRKRFSVKR